MDRPAQKNEGLTVKLRSGWLKLGGRGRRVLLAVSGGADSMALLDATADIDSSLELECHVATVDHGLRPEATGEVALVERAARERGLPFSSARLALPRGAALEERARVARYEALERLRAECGAVWIATAHTASDQAETLLMRLARGAALRGAAGILQRRGNVVRPLLGCTREEVRAYVAAKGLAFAEDPMNADATFLRARIRGEVLPALERAVGPGVVERLARFAELAAADDALLEELAGSARRRLDLGDGTLDAMGLRALVGPVRRRVLAGWLRGEGSGADFEAIDAAEAVLAGRKAGATWPAGTTFRVEGGRARVERKGGQVEFPGGESALMLDGPPLEVAGRTLRWTRDRPAAPPAQPIASTARQLVVRMRRRGDRVRLPSGRTRKLQDVLVDARVRRELRDAVLLLAETQGDVVCVLDVWPMTAPEGQAHITWVHSLPAHEAGGLPRGAL